MLTALTPISNTVLHRFASPAQQYATANSPSLCTVTRLSIFCGLLYLYSACFTFQTFVVDLVSPWCTPFEFFYLFLVQEDSGIPAALTSGAAWGGTPLGSCPYEFYTHTHTCMHKFYISPTPSTPAFSQND